jgi:hypothetical protein
MSGIAELIVAIVMAVWAYQVVNRHGGKLPWLWAIGALVLWPLVIAVAGFKYDEIAMKVVGIIGLGLIVLGLIVLGIGLVALL